MGTGIGRRRVLQWGSAGLAALGAGGRALAAPMAPDRIVINARVWTIEEAQPFAEAFAIAGDRFVAVGSTADIRAMAGPRTEVFDAQGMTVTPGFIDAHNHPIGEQLLYEVLVGNPFDVEFVTIASIIDKLKAKAKVTPPGFWVEGFFYDDTKVKDGRFINVHDLDLVSTEHPVAVHHRGGHTMFCNSKAFELAGVSKDTANPYGGTFDHFPEGGLNGRVTDLAMDRFETVGRRESFSQAEQERRAIEGQAHMSTLFARAGLTGVCHQGGSLDALMQLRDQGRLKHRVNFEAEETTLDALIKAGVRSGLGDDWIKIGATIEHLADGSLSERTMAMSRPFPGAKNGYRGNVTQSQDDLNAWVERVHRAGLRPNCHANGDVAIDHVLTAYERAAKLVPTKDVRWKITHCSQLTPELIARMKALDVTPALFSTYPYYNSDKFHFYGEEIMRNMIPFRSLLDAGVKACAGSDFYPGPFSPLMALQAMTTRKGWNGEVWGANQKISLDEALRVHTFNGAWDTKEDGIKGSIRPGKLADYVVLADDPHLVDPERLKDIKVVRTVVGGQTMYAA
jgi:predicted amidohydrolase YtcJ